MSDRKRITDAQVVEAVKALGIDAEGRGVQTLTISYENQPAIVTWTQLSRGDDGRIRADDEFGGLVMETHTVWVSR
ncbi:MAG TPA: hypothetical protein VGK17_03095 [Propionicimonas sp.]|jgi:hypothetical protein